MGTTKYSEQNHNPKEKEFKLKENSRLKSHEPVSESEFPSIFRPVPRVPHPFGQAGGCGEFALRAHYNKAANLLYAELEASPVTPPNWAACPL